VSRWLIYIRWAAIAWIVVFWRLGYPSLMDPDEAHYAELTREMLHSGSWLVPLLDGLPYIDKPVLFHWLQGASFAVLGESEFAARLPSALGALSLFAMIRWVGMRLFDRAVGEWSAIMFATIPATFALASLGLLDMVYTAFLFGAVGCLLVAARDADLRVEVAGYALLTMAVMTKGPVAILLVVMFCGAAWAAGGSLRAGIGRLHWKTGLVAAVVAAAPWFVWMYAHFGEAFVQGYVLAGNLYYFTQPESFSRRAISHVYFVRVFATAFFPWSVVVVGRAVDLALWRRSRPSLGTDEKLLWLWAAIVIAFFSVARFKLDHYIFPAAPAFCLIAAKAWNAAALGERRDARGTGWAVMAVGGGLIFAGTFASLALFELNLELPETAILLPIVLTLGGVALLWAVMTAGWRVPRTPVVPVVMLLVIYGLIVMIGLPTLEHTRPTALIASRLQQRTSPDEPAGIYRLEQWRASLRYYAQRPLARLSTPEDLHGFAAQSRPIYVIMVRRDYRSLRGSGLHLREVFRCRAVVGTIRTKSGLRRQHWDDLILVTNAPRRFPPIWTPEDTSQSARAARVAVVAAPRLLRRF
jgi:4-amino-4-deoxy-L-arabinose transferase-like glycosyltransferase